MRRVLVSGSRAWQNWDRIFSVLDAELERDADLVLVHGDCPSGADRMADAWAKTRGVPVERYPADWDQHGKAAGPIRNQQMVDTEPDLVLAFLRPESRGTRHCMGAAMKAGIPLRVYKED